MILPQLFLGFPGITTTILTWYALKHYSIALREFFVLEHFYYRTMLIWNIDAFKIMQPWDDATTILEYCCSKTLLINYVIDQTSLEYCSF